VKRVIERRYGFGAAHVALRPASLRRRPTPSLREGLAAARREEGSLLRGELRRTLAHGALPALLALLVSFVLSSALTPREETSATQLVPFDPIPPEVAMVEPEPEPIPEVAPPERAPEPEPVLPEPEPEIVAATPPPEPPPVVKPEPPRHEPPPPRRAPPRPAPALEPLAPPVVAKVEPLAPRPERAAPKPAARPTPNLAFAAAPLPSDAPERVPAQRAEPRFQAARPSDTRPRLGLAAPAAPLDAPESTRATPRSATRTPSPSAPTRSAPPLDFAAAALPATPSEAPRRDSAARRPVTAAAPPRRERGKPGTLALPASPGREPTPPAAAAAAPVRSARPSTPAPAPRREEPGLRGVALASLDACVSDRDEDALKQRVVAAAQDGGRCESAAGRFHFVETKNVNAFLMRIEHAPGRRLGDRCAELLHALDCLARGRRGGR